MADLKDEHNHSVVFNAADEAVVFNAVTPKPSQGAAQRFTETAGIRGTGNALSEIFQDGLLDAGVQFAQLAASTVVELDCPDFWLGGLSL